MITEVSNMYQTGLMMIIIGGVMGFVFAISGWDWIIMRGLAITFAIVFVIGLGMYGYYLPLEDKEQKNQQQLEQFKEAELKIMSCDSIQNYLLQSLPADNTTTKFAHSVLDIKCKGVSTA